MGHKRVFLYASEDADVYIYEPDIEQTHEEAQAYIDREISPILGQIARSIQMDYQKLCEDGYTGTFDEFYTQRKKDRKIDEQVALAESIGLVDVTDKWYPGKV